MKSKSDSSWARDIRLQVIELVSLLVLLVLVAAGYDNWTQYSIDGVRRQINDYHLVANSHYLRAMEELRNLQMHHGLHLHGHNHMHSPDGQHDLMLGDAQHSALHYLVDASLHRGIELERRFQDPRFAGLERKLEMQILAMSEAYTAYEMQTASDEELIGVFQRLLVTLEDADQFFV